MKLSEVLAERSELAGKLQELSERIIRNAKYKDGGKPAEDLTELLKVFISTSMECSDLVVHIDNTKNAISRSGGTAMVQALASRDQLEKRSLVA